MCSFKRYLNDFPFKVSSISIFALLAMMLFVVEARSQSPNIPLQGTNANYVDDGVDIFSGKLEQILKLTSIQGRGGIAEGLYLPLRNSEWTVMETSSSINNDKKYYYYRPDQTNYVNNYPRTGYNTLGQLKIETKYTGWMLFETPTVTEITFTTNKGSIIKFRDVLTNGQPYDSRSRGCVLNGYQPSDPPAACSRGRVFRAIDGSNAIFVADTEIYDLLFEGYGSANPPPQNTLAGTMFLSDGSRIRFQNALNSSFSNISRITDRNGNYMTFEYVTELNNQYNFLKKITDSLNRQITISYGDNTQASYFDEIIYKGFAQTERRIRINYTRVENAMVSPGESLGTQLFPGVHARCYYLSSGEPCDWTVAGGGAGGYATSIVVASSVVLPNGQQYQFYYNRYLELARIKYPTGCYKDYGYSGTIGAGDDGFTEPVSGGGTIYRRVSAVKTYDDTGQLISEKDFSNIPQFLAPPTGYIDNATVDVKDANGTLMSRSKHYFYDFASMQSFYTFLPADYGKEYKTENLDRVTQNVLRRTEFTWQQREEFPWCGLGIFSIYQCPSSAGIGGPAVDPRITEVKTTLETGQVAKTTVEYDQYNNVTDKYEYDFGQGQAGALLRRSHTDYITDPNYTNVDIAYLVRLPWKTWVSGDIAGANKLSFTEREYDNYTQDTNHAALVPRTNVSGYDTNFSAGFIRRGNQTAQSNFADALHQSGAIKTYFQYDVLGNPVKGIDGKGHASVIDYADRFGTPNGDARANWDTVTMPAELNGQNTFAFATSTTNPRGQTTFVQYDYSTGLIVDAEDYNQIVTASSYDDPLARPRSIIRAFNGGVAVKNLTTFDYDDVNRVVTTTTDQSSYGDNALRSQSTYDDFGRTIETRQYESATNYIAVQTQFDALGRAFKVSNPFRPGDTVVWTTTEFDSLGRNKTVTTPDNAVVTTSYSGNTITVTDQANKQRENVTDALGRLRQVYEAPNDTNYNYLTTYEYDALDNLTAVTQGAQTRTFIYDSLNRLASAINPESGRVCYGTVISGQCQSDGYDSNGNLLFRTDARGVRTSYGYDDLNRLTSRSYQNDPNNTPAVNYTYDPAIANGVGRLSSVSSSISTYAYEEYDAFGRPTRASQTLYGQPNRTYVMTYAYDLAGHTTSMTYPSNRSVNYNYDLAGRLADKDADHLAFAGNLGGGNPRTYSSGISYSAFGGMRQEQFGTTTRIYNKLLYNSRGQVAEILAATSGDDATFNRGKIVNGYSLQCSGVNCAAADNNGNLRKQTVFVPNDDQNSNPTSWYQQYDYDPLNRLKRVHEYTGNQSADWQQEYLYDRWGNRSINGNTNATWGNGINNSQAAVVTNTTTNRMYAPGETEQNHPLIGYDEAGNQIRDLYNGVAFSRVYDAESRMTKEIQANDFEAGVYFYDGEGRRVKRIVGGIETWQVYGIYGELIAEYGRSGDPLSPQKEYGYRNGQLLVTTEAALAGGPSGLAVTPPTSASSITLNWSMLSGITRYRIERQSAGVSFGFLNTTSSSTFTDASVAPNTAYLYKVCAANLANNCISGYSNIVLGSSVTFPTDPMIKSYNEDPSNATTPKAAHITELRTAVNAVRGLAGLPAVTVPNPAPQDEITVNDLRDLRAKLQDALQVLGITLPSYTDSALKGFSEDPLNATPIKAAHIRELRDAATYGQGGSSGGSGGTSFQIHWLVADQLGTPRMIFDESGGLTVTDQSGNYLSGMTRHDYLPFGEELSASAGIRSYGLGYLQEGTRQKFSSAERDVETNLDFHGSRYYASNAGRFASVDSYSIILDTQYSQRTKNSVLQFQSYLSNPQRWNAYSYALNNPLAYTDPDGLDPDWIWVHDINLDLYFSVSAEEYKKNYEGKTGFEQVTNIGPDGFVFQLNQLEWSYANDSEYHKMLGSNVYLGADGRFHAVPHGASTNDPPSNAGYLDINLSYGTLDFLGITGGVMLRNDGGTSPYIGGGFMTPGPGGAVSYSPDSVSGGMNWQAQLVPGGAYGQDEEGNDFHEFALGPPSASLTTYYVFNAPHPIHIRQHGRNMNDATNRSGAERHSSGNCACNKH